MTDFICTECDGLCSTPCYVPGVNLVNSPGPTLCPITGEEVAWEIDGDNNEGTNEEDHTEDKEDSDG